MAAGDSRLKRRGTTGALIPGGGLGALTALVVGVVDALDGSGAGTAGDVPGYLHLIGPAIAAASALFAQPLMFWIEKRADVDLANVDLARTRAALQRAFADGRWDRADTGRVLSAALDDAGDVVDDLFAGQQGYNGLGEDDPEGEQPVAGGTT